VDLRSVGVRFMVWGAESGETFSLWASGWPRRRGTEVKADVHKPTMFTTRMPQPESCAEVKGAALTEESVSDG
jgi:hypothetical protein